MQQFNNEGSRTVLFALRLGLISGGSVGHRPLTLRNKGSVIHLWLWPWLIKSVRLVERHNFGLSEGHIGVCALFVHWS